MGFWNIFGSKEFQQSAALMLVRDIAVAHSKLMAEGNERNKKLTAFMLMEAADLTRKKVDALIEMRDVYFALAISQTLYEQFINQSAKDASYHNFKMLSKATRKPYLTEQDINNLLKADVNDVERLLEEAFERSKEKENTYGTR
jgi:hypothetical protein